MESKALRVALRIWVVLVLAFLFVPIALIVLYGRLVTVGPTVILNRGGCSARLQTGPLRGQRSYIAGYQVASHLC